MTFSPVLTRREAQRLSAQPASHSTLLASGSIKTGLHQERVEHYHQLKISTNYFSLRPL